MQLYVKLEA